ncbi:hypothetical protein SAMN04487830_102156 [Pseudobutyrivibrio sp. OR37]|uniref:PIN domain-containing protein n=1 Tax=Pseudobutyrivibrio sp. OR37 TaxID=1798186 RepID=UPI0008E20E12|nr:PIN domain-containing protein [Pseudobutyrivibrio sp. OR37]SFH58515.1 hypothetical protein SAMN04487830_102156 [Pseudobutyrivibrio sp. OR37]
MLKYPITVSIDTNIFDSTQYDLSENSKLSILLNYVNNGKISVVLSNVVYGEVQAHAKKFGTEIYTKINQNKTNIRKQLSDNILRTVNLESFLDIPTEEELIKRFEENILAYMNKVCSEILDFSFVDLNEIFKDYFNIEFPFEDGRKRKEFPDAFIVNQIKNRFPDNDSVIILSSDDGLIKGLQRNRKYTILNSLDELFNMITADEKELENVKRLLQNLNNRIDEEITNYIKEHQDINVIGTYHDGKGLVYGHDYFETYLNSINNVKHYVHIIDAIEEDCAIVTLVLKADIEMNCYYKDYDNAPFDSETDDYVFVDTVHVIEKHSVNHACRIKIYFKDNSISVLPFTLHLGGDSRQSVEEIDDYEEDDDDYRLDIINQDRESFGLHPLDQFDDYLEEKVRDSDMNNTIIEAFKDYTKVSNLFENLAGICDDIIDIMNKGTSEQKQKILNGLDRYLNKEKITKYIMPDTYSEECIKEWLNKLYDFSSSISEEITEVPDDLELGKSYLIKGIDDQLEISLAPFNNHVMSENDKEWIDINVKTNNGKEASGNIELTVGFHEVDFDMNAGDASPDEIEFRYDDIIILINDFVREQNEIKQEYEKLYEALEKATEN